MIMNENNQVQVQAQATIQAQPVEDGFQDNPNEVAQAPASAKPDAIKKQYFDSKKIDAAQDAIGIVSAIAEEHSLKMVFNFDVEAPFPDGYGIAIAPISKREKSTNHVLGVAIAAIPDVATVQEVEGGIQFVHDCAVTAMIAKLSNSVRPRGDSGETAASIPFSVTDFITTNRPDGVLLSFRALAPLYVKMLKKKGLKLMTESILRQCLQSAAFAEQQFSKIDQDKWEKILSSMVATAEKEGLAAGMLLEWQKTRDSATLQDDDVDLSDLDFDVEV
jgi:hypothetical protein